MKAFSLSILMVTLMVGCSVEVPQNSAPGSNTKTNNTINPAPNNKNKGQNNNNSSGGQANKSPIIPETKPETKIPITPQAKANKICSPRAFASSFNNKIELPKEFLLGGCGLSSKASDYENDGLIDRNFVYQKNGNKYTMLTYYKGKLSSKVDYHVKGKSVVKYCHESYSSYKNQARTHRSENVYSEKGQLLSSKNFQKIGSAKEKLYNSTIQIWEKDKIVSRVEANNGIQTRSFKWKYDKEEKLISASFEDSQGKWKQSAEYLYNKEGRISKISRTGNGANYFNSSWEWDKEGNLLKRSHSLTNGKSGFNILALDDFDLFSDPNMNGFAYFINMNSGKNALLHKRGDCLMPPVSKIHGYPEYYYQSNWLKLKNLPEKERSLKPEQRFQSFMGHFGWAGNLPEIWSLRNKKSYTVTMEYDAKGRMIFEKGESLDTYPKDAKAHVWERKRDFSSEFPVDSISWSGNSQLKRQLKINFDGHNSTGKRSLSENGIDFDYDLEKINAKGDTLSYKLYKNYHLSAHSLSPVKKEHHKDTLLREDREYQYNSAGKITKETHSYGSSKRVTSSEYDNQGRNTKKTSETIYNNGKKYKSVNRLNYDSFGNINYSDRDSNGDGIIESMVLSKFKAKDLTTEIKSMRLRVVSTSSGKQNKKLWSVERWGYACK